MRIALVLGLIMIAVFWIWQNQTKPLSAQELRIALIEARSQAVQSKAIAEARASDRVTDTYCRKQLSLLLEKTDDVVSDVSSKEPEAKLRDQSSDLRDIGTTLQQIERALAVSADQQDFSSSTTRLRDLISRLNSIEQRLLAG